MDSLLATYASSDDDEPQQQHSTNSASTNTTTTTTTTSSASKSLFSYLPQPKSSSTFTSQTQHPNNNSNNANSSDPKLTTTSARNLFSALPQPKSQPQQQQQKPKKIVQIKHPFASSSNLIAEDDDEDDEDEKEKRRRNEAAKLSLETSSVKSFFATIPAPKNSASLGSGLGSGFGSGSGRRATLDMDTDAAGGIVDVSGSEQGGNQLGGVGGVDGDGNVVSHDYSNSAYGGYVDPNSGAYVDPSYGSYAGYEGYGGYQGGVGVDQSATVAGGYGSLQEYGSHGNTWGDGPGNVGAEVSSVSGESALRMLGKRGRKDVPTEIVEVKQDELMKNRPREDQVKLTGIAFGPSYKPVSTAGKPSKLHKRKHQIGSLYFDMKQREMELQERRAKGFLTKAETQAKYGW